MRIYIKKSFEKFKQDALSKVFYDTLKKITTGIVILLCLKIIPEGSYIDAIFSKMYSFSLYAIILYSLLLILLTTISISLFYRKKYLAIKSLASLNPLTGLKNNVAFKSYLISRIKEIKESEKTFSIVISDVDNFKNFNTSFNPNIADEILGKVGELLGNDKRVTDETFRQFLRGDEFVVIMNDTNLNDAFKAAERKRKLIETTSFIIGNNVHKLSVCCGVTELKKDDTFDSITERMNIALIEAKSQANKNNTKTAI